MFSSGSSTESKLTTLTAFVGTNNKMSTVLNESFNGSSTLQGLYDSIPKDLSPWSRKMCDPANGYEIIKGFTYPGIGAVLLLLSMSIALGAMGSVTISTMLGVESAIVLTASLANYFVTNHFKNKFMNKPLDSTETVILRMKRELMSIMKEEMQEISDKYQNKTAFTESDKKQFELLFLLGKFTDSNTKFMKLPKFDEYINERNR